MLQGEEKHGIGMIIQNLFLMLFTDNLFKSAANMDLLPLIVFSIVFAAVLTTMGKRVDGVIKLIEQGNDALIATVLVFMKIAPIGIFCLVAYRFGEAHVTGEIATELKQIGKYFVTVLVALGVHAFGTLPLIFWLFTKRNPFVFMLQNVACPPHGIFDGEFVRHATAHHGNGDREGRRFGRSPPSSCYRLAQRSTWDGTALYEAVAAIFVAQVALMELGLSGQIVVAVTATLAAIGAAGIPEAGLVTMLIVFNAVGLPVEYIGLILSVDWLLDRFRTTVNVFGDTVGASVVDQVFAREDRTLLANDA